MRIIVNNKNKKKLAELIIKDGQVEFVDKYDKDFYDFIQKELENGFEVFRTDLQKTQGTDSVLLSKVKILSSDHNFYEHFYKFLYTRGFIIYEIDTPADKEIRELLNDYPNIPQKDQILASLNSIERLEKTAILKILKEDKD